MNVCRICSVINVDDGHDTRVQNPLIEKKLNTFSKELQYFLRLLVINSTLQSTTIDHI